MKDAIERVTAFEATPASSKEAIVAPTTVEEATTILKRDRLDAFPLVVTWLEERRALQGRDPADTLEDTALLAQVQLAWGEAESLIGELLSRSANLLEQEVEAALLVDAGADVADERARIAEWRRTDEALRLLAVEHIAIGAREADFTVALAADSYIGYRIGADAARLTNNWARFEVLVEKVEAVRPESNGLRFLRGVQAWSQQQDAEVAAFELQAAIEADPQFIRALVWLVVVSPAGREQRAALERLALASPDHQLVRLAGPGIRATTPSSSSSLSSSSLSSQPN